MAVWTIVPDSAQLPDQPIKSTDQIAIKNNITALAEGASGAPRILTAAYNNLSVTNAKLATDAVTNVKVVNGTLGAEKFQTGTTERDWVLARSASASVGAVGTYGLFRNAFAVGLNPGDTVSGSSLKYASAGDDTATIPAGTWRCMGFAIAGGSGAATPAMITVFLRIS